MDALLLVMTALALAAPSDPCQQPPTFWTGRSASHELSGVPFHWTTRQLHWEQLEPRFTVVEQRTLLTRDTLRIDAVLGTEEVAIVVGKRLKGDWCATSVWHEYFGGKGLDVTTVQAVSVNGATLLLLDGTGNFSSPPGATERILKLARVGSDGSMDEPAGVHIKVGPTQTLELARGNNGIGRLLVRGDGLVDVYHMGLGTESTLAYQLPGMGSSPKQARALLTAACRKAQRTRAEHGQDNFFDLGQVFEGKLERIGAIRHPAEDDLGTVLELTFSVTKVFRDVDTHLTRGGLQPVVVPVASPLADDILLAHDYPTSLPADCLGRLGLPDAPSPGSNYLVAAHETWEASQTALPPTKSTNATRTDFVRRAREAGFVDRFKADFTPTDSFAIVDQGESFEITVHRGSTGVSEGYILDKQTGRWELHWGDIPTPDRGWH